MRPLLDQVKIISLPKISDARGNLSFVEQQNHIPFDIKRTYWIYDVPGGEERGGHAFISTQEFIIALSGSFDLLLDDGMEKIRICLNRPYFGVYVPKGIWREILNFSTNSFALEVASTSYDPNEYIRDYSKYKTLRENGEI